MKRALPFAICAAAFGQDLTIDTGYRFLSNPAGDFNTYRSVVNLGEGPKLFGADLNVSEWKNPLFDQLTVSTQSWGGEPYTSLRASIGRAKLYRIHGDYRNAAYYNFLPSFALNQRGFDLRRRISSVEAEVLPSSRIIPYIAYSRDSGTGTGVTPFVANANEYPVATALDDGTHNVRGGARIETSRLHATLEQGSSVFSDGQRVFTSLRNLGNRESTLFGRTLFLNSLDQAYRVHGGNVYSKGSLAASPTGWLRVSGHIIYSRPRSDVRYTDQGRGLFYVGGTVFSPGFETLLTGASKMPRTSASTNVDIQAHRKLRVTQFWMTDRLSDQLTVNRIAVNFHREQTEAFFDPFRGLTLRGGHRFVWGDASVPGQGKLRQHVGLAGATFRAGTQVSASADYEGSPGDRSYFRTSLHNYHQLRARVRGQVAKSLSASGSFFLLDNKNPNQGANFDLASTTAAASLQWAPGGGKLVSVTGEYSRSMLHTNVWYLVPQLAQRAESDYRDNTHAATGLVDLHPSKTMAMSMGGSLVTTSGTRPTRYYQPMGRASMPFSKTMEGYGEWRWYGLSQTFFVFEGFRAHQFTIGLRVSLERRSTP